MKESIVTETNTAVPQCQFFVVRKKRLCRMTLRPGKQYCGEHDPNPDSIDGDLDNRIPCPLDPKHTCYASKLEKHLKICNAKPGPTPDYIEWNVNAPQGPETPRPPLTDTSADFLQTVVDKINKIYEEHVEKEIEVLPERDIHSVVEAEFNEAGRTESSRRHLRQVSRLLWLLEDEGLVRDHTCYVELGAGKGALLYYCVSAWCEGSSRGLAVERAALRHKRDNRLPPHAARRLRADLAHLVLGRLPLVRDAGRVIAIAKHLCGAATDYGLRCVLGAMCAGAALLTCCHHRVEPTALLGRMLLQDLGLSSAELDVLLGVVSWATCGTGRARGGGGEGPDGENGEGAERGATRERGETGVERGATGGRGETGRRAKALLDWARAGELRAAGYRARLMRLVPEDVSPENMCLLITKEAS